MRAMVTIVNDGQLIYVGLVDSVVNNCSAKLTHIVFTTEDICLIRFSGNAINPIRVESKIDNATYVQVVLNDKCVATATKKG
jgi:hypothetical protein